MIDKQRCSARQLTWWKYQYNNGQHMKEIEQTGKRPIGLQVFTNRMIRIPLITNHRYLVFFVASNQQMIRFPKRLCLPSRFPYPKPPIVAAKEKSRFLIYPFPNLTKTLSTTESKNVCTNIYPSHRPSQPHKPSPVLHSAIHHFLRRPSRYSRPLRPLPHLVLTHQPLPLPRRHNPLQRCRNLGIHAFPLPYLRIHHSPDTQNLGFT